MPVYTSVSSYIGPWANGRYFAGDIFKGFSFMKHLHFIPLLLNAVSKGPIDSKSTLVKVMAWCRTGTKPLPKPMMTQLSDTHMCRHPELAKAPSHLVTIWGQWINTHLDIFGDEGWNNPLSGIRSSAATIVTQTKYQRILPQVYSWPPAPGSQLDQWLQCTASLQRYDREVWPRSAIQWATGDPHSMNGPILQLDAVFGKEI